MCYLALSKSRFYAVLSKAAQGSLALNPRRSKYREPEHRKSAKVFELVESIEMAFLRLEGPTYIWKSK